MPIATGRGALGARLDAGRAPSPYAYEWFVRAELLAAKQEGAAAIAAYRAALPDTDDDPYVLGRLALALDAQGDEGGALGALDDALALDPDSEALWLARGRISSRHGRWSEAFGAYERAQAVAPESFEPALAESELAEQLGAAPRALALLERLATGGSHAHAAALRAQALLAGSGGDRSALVATSAALARVVGGPEPLRRAAELFLERHEAALAGRLLEGVPASDSDRLLRLRIALALGQDERAELQLSAGALAGAAEALDRAQVWLALERPARALEELTRQTEARDREPYRHARLQAQSELALGGAAHAALALARIPAASAEHRAALAALRRACAAAGLFEMANEIDDPGSVAPRP
jgi:hypothetical protein